MPYALRGWRELFLVIPSTSMSPPNSLLQKPLSTLVMMALPLGALAAVSPLPAGISEAAGFWTQAVGEGNLSSIDDSLSSVRLWVEGQGRFNNANPMSNMNWYQGMARTAMGSAVTDRLTVWAGIPICKDPA
jgi:hypothetical protein